MAGPVGVAFRVSLLGACPSLWSGCAALQLFHCPPRFPSFPLAGACAFVGGWGFSPSARAGRQTVWLTGSLLVLWVAAGRAPDLTVLFEFPDHL